MYLKNATKKDGMPLANDIFVFVGCNCTKNIRAKFWFVVFSNVSCLVLENELVCQLIKLFFFEMKLLKFWLINDYACVCVCVCGLKRVKG